MNLRLILLLSMVAFGLQLLLEYAKTTRVAVLYLCVLLLVAAATLANTQFTAAQTNNNQLVVPTPSNRLTLSLPTTRTPLNKPKTAQLQAVLSSQQFIHPGNFALYINQYLVASALRDETNSLIAQAAIVQSHPLSLCKFENVDNVLKIGCRQ